MKKLLERDKERAVVAGVLAGFGVYFNQDPVLFRIFALLFLIVTGIFPGLLFYLAAWIVMPERKVREADYEVVD